MKKETSILRIKPDVRIYSGEKKATTCNQVYKKCSLIA